MSLLNELTEIKKSTPSLEGFWYSRSQPNFPKPIENSLKNEKLKQLILDKLSKIEESCDYDGYRGWSNCRVCDCRNGSREFKLDNWRWPQGFKHYIEAHNVKPSKKFIEEVLNLKDEQ